MGCHSGSLVTVLSLLGLVAVCNATLENKFDTWQPHAVKYWDDGQGITLNLYEGDSAAGCGTKDSYLYGHFGAWIKLPGGKAAGTVATFYLTSPHPGQCEFDLEMLGHNGDGHRLIHTNVFVDGNGGMEQQIMFPDGINPTTDYHYYSFEWHEDMVVFYIDWKPIRMFKNLEASHGIKYCDHKAMGVFMSIWDGDSWATEGGSIKLDWSQAPFQSKYSDLQINGCKVPKWDNNGIDKCRESQYAHGPGLNDWEYQHMRNIRNNATMVKYNYCADTKRYPEGTRPECSENAM